MSSTPETIVHLVRHGEVHNPDAILYGRSTGFHLSERGLRMADRIADRIVKPHRPADMSLIGQACADRGADDQP